MARKGLGKGLDSLIPEIYDEDFDSNSPLSLEDMLNEQEESAVEEEKPKEEKKNIFEEIEEENDRETDSASGGHDYEEEDPEDKEADEDSQAPEEGDSEIRAEDSIQETQKIQVDPSHVDEVTKIVDKNPRITLWSSRSAAVLRYLRKTEPEFSISKEASTLIDEAVSKKYPEIWALFNQY